MTMVNSATSGPLDIIRSRGAIKLCTKALFAAFHWLKFRRPVAHAESSTGTTRMGFGVILRRSVRR